MCIKRFKTRARSRVSRKEVVEGIPTIHLCSPCEAAEETLRATQRWTLSNRISKDFQPLSSKSSSTTNTDLPWTAMDTGSDLMMDRESTTERMWIVLWRGGVSFQVPPVSSGCLSRRTWNTTSEPPEIKEEL